MKPLSRPSAVAAAPLGRHGDPVLEALLALTTLTLLAVAIMHGAGAF